MARTKQVSTKQVNNNNNELKTDETGKKQYTRNKPGITALKEIKKEQKRTNLIIPKTSFERLVKEVSGTLKTNMRWKRKAIESLHHMSESFIIELFNDAYNCTLNAERVTLEPKDMHLALSFYNKKTPSFSF